MYKTSPSVKSMTVPYLSLSRRTLRGRASRIRTLDALTKKVLAIIFLVRLKKTTQKPQGILKQNPFFQGLTLISSVRRTKHVYRRLVPLIDVQVISIK